MKTGTTTSIATTTSTATTTSVAAWSERHRDLDRLDRELLLAEALDTSRAQVLAHPERELAGCRLARLETWAGSRRRGTPLAYLLQRKEFWGLTLRVNEAVLVPRPETELLVELILAGARAGDRILDLGTGSGAIAIAVAGSLPDTLGTEIVGSDVSPAALAVAAGNAASHGANVCWLASDWFNAVAGRFDQIASNPPYVADTDPCLAGLSAEPRQALAAGGDGLDAIRRIVPGARGRLNPGGRLLLEHGHDQGQAVRALFARHGYRGVATHRDLAGRERVTLGQRP